MPFRSLLSVPLLAAVLMSAGSARAEDPFLGIIKEIKCVNCKPGWVTLVINDPIETRDFELYLKDTDYNKIITPLPGKSIHEKDGECFYWMEKPKAPKAKEVKTAPAESAGTHGATGPKAAPVGKGGAKKPAAHGTSGAAGKPTADSEVVATPNSSPAMPPPTPEAQGTPSSCIRFYRQTN